MNEKEKAEMLTKAASAAKATLPKGWGIVLILCPMETWIDSGGEFITDILRQDAIVVMRDTALRVEKNLTKTQ